MHINPTIFEKVSFLQLDSYDSGISIIGSGITLQSGGISSTIEYKIRSSRLFGTHNQYPPNGFSAYAIVAFSSSATSESMSRYTAICEGYLNTLVASKRLVKENQVLRSSQFATIWPLLKIQMAEELNDNFAPRNSTCSDIVGSIDLLMSREAIQRAENHLDEELTGDGPYLLAWSPGQRYDDVSDDVPVFVLDLSDVRNAQQAANAFNFWSRKIEKDPGVWEDGWSFERLKLKVEWWVSRYGSEIVRFIGFS